MTRRGDERGSAVVELLGVLGLLGIVLLAVVHGAFYVYARSVATSAAVESARHGAAIGAEPGEATSAARDLLGDALGGLAAGLRVREYMSAGAVHVEIDGVIPAVGPLPDLPVRASGSAHDERAVVP